MPKPTSARTKKKAINISGQRDRVSLLFQAAMVLCSAVTLWVIWSNRFLLLQDLPDHIARASILKDYILSDQIRHYYRIAWFPVPYLLPDLLNAALLIVFDPISVSKIFASLAAISLIAGSAYFLHRTNRSRMELSLFSCALLFTNVFAKGNLNFILGTGVMLFVVGWWWPIRRQLSNRQSVVLGIAAIVLYGIHIICLFVACVIAGVSFVFRTIERRKFELSQLLPALPALLLVLAFMLWNGSGAETSSSFGTAITGAAYLKGFAEKPSTLATLFNVVTIHDYRYFLPMMALYLLFLATFLWKSPLTEKSAVFWTMLLLVLLLPQEMHRLVVRPDERILYIALFWGLAVMDLPFRKLQRQLVVWWIVIASATCIFQDIRVQQMNGERNADAAKEYDLFRMIPAGSLVIDLPYREWRALQHFYKFAVAGNQCVVPGMFTIKPYCVRYRQPLPAVTLPPVITPAMLNTYDYFISNGMDRQILDLVFKQKRLRLVWSSGPLALLENPAALRSPDRREPFGTGVPGLAPSPGR